MIEEFVGIRHIEGTDGKQKKLAVFISDIIGQFVLDKSSLEIRRANRIKYGLDTVEEDRALSMFEEGDDAS